MNDTLTWRKIFSGQFIFTVVTAGVFAYAVYNKILNSEQVYGIIMLVLAFYFSKSNNQQSGGLNGQQTTMVTAPNNAAVNVSTGPGTRGNVATDRNQQSSDTVS